MIKTPKTKETPKLSQLIEKGGFDYVNPNIAKLFKTEPTANRIEIKNFGRLMSSEEVIKELAKDWCRPANATELFTWYLENKDSRFMDKQNFVGIVALGSVASFEGDRRVPYAWWHDSERHAGLHWFDNDWLADYCFAFSRESSETLPKPLETLPLELIINGITYKRV